jgi:hypothetical protein
MAEATIALAVFVALLLLFGLGYAAGQRAGGATSSPSLVFRFDTKEGTFMSPQVVQITDQQQIPFTLAAVDAKGAPTSQPLAGVTVASSDSTVAAVTVNPDGTGGVVTAGNPGTAQLSATATVTKADGTTATIVAQGTCTVIGGDAVSVAFAFGAPTQQG